MRRFLMPVPLVLAVFAAGCEGPTQPAEELSHPNHELQELLWGSNAVIVAPPTGDAATDVANIEAAIAEAETGDIIQFRRGTYVVAEGTQILLSTPGVTLRGSILGTTIYGVQGGGYPLEGIFWMNGGRQSVVRLSFENFATALTLGEPGSTDGGYRVLGCAFRNGDLALGIVGFSDDASKVALNRFVNVSIPFFMYGKTLHFSHNWTSVPDPGATPWGQPFNAGAIFPESWVGGPTSVCENNVIEHNQVRDQADGFMMLAFGDEVCRNNVIRQNTFKDQRIYNVLAPLFDSGTMVYLLGNIESTLIEKNELRGSEGVGMMFEGGPTRNIISNNRISDLPGEVAPCCAPPGVGIYLDPWTSLNQVVGNKFFDVLEPIVDLGTDNTIQAGILAATVAPQDAALVQAAPNAADVEKVRYVTRKARNDR